MADDSSRPVGRPPSATREQVLELATDQFRRGERLDLTGLATTLRLSRATLYRWFGSREELIATVLTQHFDLALALARSRATGSGAPYVLSTLSQLQELVRAHEGLQHLLQREGTWALRILTADGPFQRHVVACVEGLMVEAATAGHDLPAIPVETLAYAIVRLAEAFIYSDSAVGARSDFDRLVDVERVLLGIPAAHPY